MRKFILNKMFIAANVELDRQLGQGCFNIGYLIFQQLKIPSLLVWLLPDLKIGIIVNIA